MRLSYGSIANVLTIIEENNYYPFGLKHSGYNNTINGSNPTKKYYQGQERQDELGLNWDSFKWRNYDYAIGRFMSIDPLCEKYTYNSTYAFQENKMGMGRELEGLELMPWDHLRIYVAAKIASFKTSVSNTLHSAVGNDGQPSLSGTTSNVNIAGYNVEKIKDLAKVAEVGKKSVIHVARKTANALEDIGDKTTIVSAATVQPEGVIAGETMSTSGKLINSGLDLAEGKPVAEVATDLGISFVLAKAGDKIVEKAVDKGVIKEHAQLIVKTVEKKVEEIIKE